jgi:synaptosomal-associated protein 29
MAFRPNQVTSSSSAPSSKGQNPFYDDLNEDVDDYTFLAHPQQGSSGYLLGNGQNGSTGPSNQAYLERRQQLLEERRKIEERTLESSKISLGLLYESEKVGLSTAEELVNQGEKLVNVEKNLDTINNTMRVSQKHLNSMKSIFGGIKNYFSRGPEAPPPALPSSRSSSGISTKSTGYSPSNLQSTIDRIQAESGTRSAENHPALAARGLDTSGFRFDDEDDYSKERNHGAQGQGHSGHASRSAVIDKQLNANLGELDMGLGRLKGLALGLGTEIDSQNELLDHVTTKAERAQDTIGYQNRQMRQILKK